MTEFEKLDQSKKDSVTHLIAQHLVNSAKHYETRYRAIINLYVGLVEKKANGIVLARSSFFDSTNNEQHDDAILSFPSALFFSPKLLAQLAAWTTC